MNSDRGSCSEKNGLTPSIDGETNNSGPVRILETADLPLVMALYRSRNKLMGMSRPEAIETQFQNTMEGYLSSSNRDRVLVGHFSDSHLSAMVGMYFWSAAPYWSLLKLVVRKSETHQIFNPETNGLHHCLQYCLHIAEARHCFTYFTLSSLRHHRVLARTGSSFESLGGRYAFFIEEVVPANTRPKHDYIWNMMGQQVWSDTLVVRSGHLLTEHRTIVREKLSDGDLKPYRTNLNYPLEKKI